VGRLAGGIAHDFNNLLTAIIGFNALAAGALDEGHPATQDIGDSTGAARKAAELVRQLLAFARRDVVQSRDVDLNGLLANMERLLRRLIGEDIDLRFAASAVPLVCLVDPGQFEQVVVNLAVNARDAMPMGGILTIEARSVTLDALYAATRQDVTPGEYALIEVTDNGTGIQGDVLEHIFEPFFTTKDQGQGTGLGLATCYGIVKQAGGHIAAYTELGHGTTFKIYLPLAASSAAAIAVEASPVLTRGHGSATVMLVEDKSEVRALAERVLLEAGYGVIAVDTPLKALELAAGAPRIDLIISDVIMPFMDGVTLTELLASLLGPRPVLLISGYAEESVVSRASGRKGLDFLPKPFSPETLLARVAGALYNWTNAPDQQAPDTSFNEGH
jgi:CheY-like chemotaxis protein